MLCFDLYKDSRYYRSFVLKDEETNETYRQTFKISFFELRKAVSELSQTKEVETFELSGLTARDQWALFINSGQQEVYEKFVFHPISLKIVRVPGTASLRKHMSV